MKKVIRLSKAPGTHWVGDGFPVQGMFGYQGAVDQRSPFLLLDYAAPTTFPPNTGDTLGVATHPHRGFETVTIVYDGEVAHRDSTGAGGVIGPGDVQWMTAGSGILHREYHSEAYSKKGGPFHMAQLWVNLPAKDKMTSPAYQPLLNADIPAVALPDNAGQVRLIAGSYAGQKGAASTFTPMNVWDIQIKAGAQASLPQSEGWNTLLLVQSGTVQVNGEQGREAQDAQLLTLSREGSEVLLQARTDTRVLLMAGEPIDEPVVGHGPFVMNTREEISQAVEDYSNGKFGSM